MKAKKQQLKSGFNINIVEAKINGIIYKFIEGIGIYNVLGDKIA